NQLSHRSPAERAEFQCGTVERASKLETFSADPATGFGIRRDVLIEGHGEPSPADGGVSSVLASLRDKKSGAFRLRPSIRGRKSDPTWLTSSTSLRPE